MSDWNIFKKKTPAEVDADPAYRKVKDELRGLWEIVEKHVGPDPDLVMVERYIEALIVAGAKPVLDVTGDKLGLDHLYWMLTVLEESIGVDPRFDDGKIGRWLGFIQYGLISHGLFTVEGERDFSRPLYNPS